MTLSKKTGHLFQSTGGAALMSLRLAFSLVLCLGYAGIVAAQTTDQPNILFFLADDMGWGDSRILNANAQFEMPNLEALAAEGMSFTDAHTTAAKCAPSRYSILTGNYQWRGKNAWGHWTYYGGMQILPDQNTVADVARRAGYATALIGKLHLGGDFYLKDSNKLAKYTSAESDVDFARGLVNGPDEYGFDYSYSLLRGIQRSPYAYFENSKIVGNPASITDLPAGRNGLSEIIQAGPGMPNWDSSTSGAELVKQAIAFIDRHHRQNLANNLKKPFFLYYSSQAAHAPNTPPVSLNGKPVQGFTGISPHLDMVYELDVALGALVQALESRDLADDTVIIFTSDNGGVTTRVDREGGHLSVGELAGRKGEIGEGGHRVPFVVKWGDGTFGGSRVRPGTKSKQLVGTQDLMATVAELVGQSLGPNQARDSLSLLPVLTGQIDDAKPIRDHLIAESDSIDGVPAERQFGYREGKYKLILDADNKPLRLYNLDSDIRERRNLIERPALAGRVESMRASFVRRRLAERTTTRLQLPKVSIRPQRFNESDGMISVIVNLDRKPAAGRPVTVTIGTSRARGTATADVDYQPANTALTFEPDGTAQSMLQEFKLRVIDDDAREPKETIALFLARVVGARKGTASEVTIIDDDGATGGSLPVLSVKRQSFSEKNGAIRLAVQLSKSPPPGSRVVAEISTTTRGSTATPGEDYVARKRVKLVFDGNSRGRPMRKLVRIKLLDDTLRESIETIGLRFSRINGARVGRVIKPRLKDND